MSAALRDIPFALIDGAPATLAGYAGKVVLAVNVASKCGLTPQYERLEALYRAKKDAGLVILGFPANNFLGQEPGTEEEIASFCATTYDVTFPLARKISVAGADRHPLYDALIAAKPATLGDGPFREKLAGYGIPANPPDQVLWNFEKFLIGRDGAVAERFAPDVEVDDPRFLAVLGKALAAPV
jgi:glutathione peroxidase